MQTIWGDPQRFVNQYYKKYNTNPQARIGVTGPTTPPMAPCSLPTATNPRILGRVDDVINVAGPTASAPRNLNPLASPCRKSPKPPSFQSWTK